MAKEENNNFGILSVSCSILGICLALVPVFGLFAGILLSVLGIVFGIIQFRHAKNHWATWGIILGAVGIVGNIVAFKLIVSWAQKIAQEALASSAGATA